MVHVHKAAGLFSALGMNQVTGHHLIVLTLVGLTSHPVLALGPVTILLGHYQVTLVLQLLLIKSVGHGQQTILPVHYG